MYTPYIPIPLVQFNTVYMTACPEIIIFIGLMFAASSRGEGKGHWFGPRLNMPMRTDNVSLLTRPTLSIPLVQLHTQYGVQDRMSRDHLVFKH